MGHSLLRELIIEKSTSYCNGVMQQHWCSQFCFIRRKAVAEFLEIPNPDPPNDKSYPEYPMNEEKRIQSKTKMNKLGNERMCETNKRTN